MWHNVISHVGPIFVVVMPLDLDSPDGMSWKCDLCNRLQYGRSTNQRDHPRRWKRWICKKCKELAHDIIESDETTELTKDAKIIHDNDWRDCHKPS